MHKYLINNIKMNYKTILLNHLYTEVEIVRFRAYKRQLSEKEEIRYKHLMKQISMLKKKSSEVTITDYEDVFEPSSSDSSLTDSRGCCVIS